MQLKYEVTVDDFVTFKLFHNQPKFSYRLLEVTLKILILIICFVAFINGLPKWFTESEINFSFYWFCLGTYFSQWLQINERL